MSVIKSKSILHVVWHPDSRVDDFDLLRLDKYLKEERP
jgi:hypothetical protein